MNTNVCPGGCVNEDHKCATLQQCNPRTANVTLAYSGLRDQLVGSASGYSKLTAPMMPTEVFVADGRSHLFGGREHTHGGAWSDQAAVVAGLSSAMDTFPVPGCGH